MRQLRNTLCFLMLGMVTNEVFAQDDFFSTIEVDEYQEELTEESDTFSYKGFLQQKIKYGTQTPDNNFNFDRDSRGISQIQTDMFGEFSGTLSSSIAWRFGAKLELDWIQWDNGELEQKINHEKLFIRDAYVDMTFDSGVWLRAGHQLFAWGESEGLAITDVISPRDAREPGQAELRDLREQVPAVMTSLPVKSTKLIAVFTYDAGHDRFADRSEEFFPFITFGSTPVRILDPDKAWEFALRWEIQFNGGDVTFIVADVNDNTPVLTGIEVFPPVVKFQQERLRVVGVSGNRAMNSWLLKAEFAQWNISERDLFVEQKDQYRSMTGLEYSGWNDWLLSVEWNNIYLEQSPAGTSSAFADDRSSNGAVLRVQRNDFNERMTNQLWLLHTTGGEGDIARWDFSWEWSDAVELGVTAVLYDSDNTDEQLYPYRNNDSLNVFATWNF